MIIFNSPINRRQY